MSDVNANISVNIDSSQALAQLKVLQRQISEFHSSVAKSSEAAALAQKSLQKNLVSSVNSIGAFSAELRTVNTTAESFTKALENNKLSMREYFRYSMAATKTFGNNFRSEIDTIGKVAEERVKTLQTQYIKMGRDANGAMKAIAVRPLVLDMNDLGTKTQIAAQKQAIFNQLLKQGSTNLLNFGKNTQWAGRQLMVGFTLPLMAFGAAASKSFQQLETEVIKFKKVYGDLGTNSAQTEQALKNIKALADGYTKYGVEVSKTVGLASQAAAAGFQSADLIAQTDAATKLSILGQIDQQQALETTISLQNAFKISSTELATTIDFLNAVENQTVTSLDDITTAIPKVAPVIQSLGGDVKDLAFFLTAMKEGGVNAAEGANALKSGLASLINPTNKASQMLGGMGININNIVTKNKGNLKATVIEFAKALDTLDPLARARAIETMFGKFQFARISTLLSNVIQTGNQASRVLDLAGQSTANLARLTEKELGITAESALVRFQAAMAKLKASLAPVGEVFMKAFVPVVDFISGLLDKFNGLSDGTKKFIAITVGVIGGLGPIALMTFGLLANGIANILKLFMTLRNGYQRLTGQSQNLGEQTQYLTTEQLNAAAAAHSLEQSHARLTQQFTVEAGAVNQLRTAYQNALTAGTSFALMNPGMMRTPKKFANGGIVVSGPGGPKDDKVPANLSNGEVVLSVNTVKQNPAIVAGLLRGGKVNIPGYANDPGSIVGAGASGDVMDTQIKGYRNATIFLQNWLNQQLGAASGASRLDVISSLKQSGGAASGNLLAVMAKQMGLDINDPSIRKEFMGLGTKLTDSAVTALEASGKAIINDADLEEIIVPAFKNTAKNIKVAGKEVSTSLNAAIDEVRTLAVVGSGTGSPVPRTSVGGSYIDVRETGQDLAIEMNPENFRRATVPSKSKGSKVQFQQKNVQSTLDQVMPKPGPSPDRILKSDSEIEKSIKTRARQVWLKQKNAYTAALRAAASTAQNEWASSEAAHIMPGITATARQIEEKISGIVSDSFKKVSSFAAKASNLAEQRATKIGQSAVKAIARGARTASASQATRQTGRDIIEGLRMELAAGQPKVAIVGGKVGTVAVDAVDNAVVKETAKRPGMFARIFGKNKITDSEGKNLGSMLSGQGMMAGMGIMAGSMALSALPEFTGKVMVQSSMNMASIGAMFGPWGAAAGAAIGLVSSGLTKILDKQRELKEVSKAVFESSAAVAQFFGNTVVEVDAKLSNYSIKIEKTKNENDKLTASVKTTNQQLKAFKELIDSLSTEDPLKKIVDNLAKETDPERVRKVAEAFITTQIALGQLKAEQGQTTLDLILASSNHLAMVGSVSMKVKSQAEAVTKAINNTKGESDKLGIVLTQVSAGLRNASSYKELQQVLDAVAASGYNASDGIMAMYSAYMAVGNTIDASIADVLSRVQGATVATLMAVQNALSKGIDITVGGKTTVDDIYKQISAGYTKLGASAFATNNKISDQDKKQIASNDAKIKGLEKRKAELDKILKKEQSISDELNRQNDYTSKQQDLDQKIAEAKMRGDYIGATILQQDKLANAAQFAEDTRIAKITKERDELESKITELKDNTEKIKDSTTATKNLTSAINNFKPGKFLAKDTAGQNTYVPPTKKEIGPGSIVPGRDAFGKSLYEVFKNPKTGKFIQIKTPSDLAATVFKSLVDAGYVFHKYAPKGISPDLAKVYQDVNTVPVVDTDYPGETILEKYIREGTQRKANGGLIHHYDNGGRISGPGTATSDSIPAMLSDGEYVINASSVAKYGTGLMDSINAGKYASGGPVMPNVLGKGMDWLGKTLFSSGNSLIKGLLGFDITKPFSQKSGMEKFSMASMLVPGSSGAKAGIKAAKLADTEALKYFVSRGFYDEHSIDLVDQVMAATVKGNKKNVKGMSLIEHDPLGISTLQGLFSNTGPRATKDMLGLSLMLGAKESGTTKTGIALAASADRSMYSEALVKGLERRGLGNVIGLPEKDLVTAFGNSNSKALSARNKTLKNLSNDKLVMDNAIEIPELALNASREALSKLLTTGYNQSEFKQLLSIFNKSMKNSGPGFANGGLVMQSAPHDMGLQWGGQEKLNAYQKFMLGIARSAGPIDKFFGIDSIFRTLAGKPKGKGDIAFAAMAPLEGLGSLGKGAVKAGAQVPEFMRSSKASFTLIQNLHKKALEFAQESGKGLPEMFAGDLTNAPTALMRAPKTELEKAYHYFWGKAHEILSTENNPIVKDLSKNDFISKVGNFGTTAFTSSDQLLGEVPKFLEEANKAYLKANGLSPEQPLALFKAVRKTTTDQVKMMEQASSKPFQQQFDESLGGYWSLGSKFAGSYLRNLNANIAEDTIGGMKVAGETPIGGLFKLILNAKDFRSPIGIGAMPDEYTAMLPADIVKSIGTAKRVGSGWVKPLFEDGTKVGKSGTHLGGPQREPFVRDLYDRFLPFTKIENLSDTLKSKILENVTPEELKMLSNVSKTTKDGKSILDKTMLDGMLHAVPFHEGIGNILNIAKKLESITGEPIAKLRSFMPGLSKGGLATLPKFHDWNGVVPGQYGQELNAVLKSGTEGVYQNEYIAKLKNGASENLSTSDRNTVYNNHITISGTDLNKKEIADEVLVRLAVVQKRNNMGNKVMI